MLFRGLNMFHNNLVVTVGIRF